MLIEIHMIQNHSPSNLNRDDLGAPKTCLFGGVPRARISSQCLKRSIRKPNNPNDIHSRNASSFAEALQAYIGTRTKFFPWSVGEQLKRQEELGIPKDQRIPGVEWDAVVYACAVVAQKADKESRERIEKAKADSRPATKQLIFLGPRHAAEFVKKLAELRTTNRISYDYFQDPRVVFTTLLEIELESTTLDEEQQKRILKNCWLVVKYPHRWQALTRWAFQHLGWGLELDEEDSDDHIDTTQDLPERPAKEEAQTMARILNEMVLRAEDEKQTKDLLEDLLKAKTTSAKKWQGQHEEGRIDDKRNKPRHYEEFQKRLWRATGPMAIDIALFGRMTTSEAFEDVEAAMQVAHAISTHKVVNEVDYFTAVDDLGSTSGGAAHVDEAMFNSACFYKYFCLDWDQLVHNLAGTEPDPQHDPEGHRKWKEDVSPHARRLAASTVGHFLRAAALTNPSGKQNSYAAHNEPCGILVEIKKKWKTPTSYANAFAEPVERVGKPEEDAADESSIEGRSVACLADHVHSMRVAYGIASQLLWYSPKLWRFPLKYWKRTEDGKKLESEPLTALSFNVLGAEDGEYGHLKAESEDVSGGDNGMPRNLVEAVINSLGVNLEWADVKDLGKTSAKEV